MTRACERAGQLAVATCAVLACTAALAAQTVTQPEAGQSGSAARALVTLPAYDEPSSRAAFTAIDRSADDRLDVLEFADAQEEKMPADRRDHGLFRRLDVDRDGFLSWPEFDERVRHTIRVSGEFRYRPARKPVAPRPPPDAEALSPAQVQNLLVLLDRDRSGKVSREEFVALLTVAGLPATLLGQFVLVDGDGDRQLDLKELAALARVLPGATRPPAPAGAKSIGTAWRRADRDGDGEVSISEMEAALHGLDLYLGRWAEKVVADADRTGDRRLGPAEILAAEPARSTSGAKR